MQGNGGSVRCESSSWALLTVRASISETKKTHVHLNDAMAWMPIAGMVQRGCIYLYRAWLGILLPLPLLNLYLLCVL
jgi:hypothetical protein